MLVLFGYAIRAANLGICLLIKKTIVCSGIQSSKCGYYVKKIFWIIKKNLSPLIFLLH